MSTVTDAGFAFATAFNLDAGWIGAVARTGHLAPGFAVDLIDGAAVTALRIEINLRVQFRFAARHHVPEILRNDVGRDEVDLARGIAPVAASAVHDVVPVHKAPGFNLHAPQLVSRVEDEVAGVTVSPNFGHSKTETGGFGEKVRFRLAAGFTRREADGVKLGNALARNASLLAERKRRSRMAAPFEISLYFQNSKLGRGVMTRLRDLFSELNQRDGGKLAVDGA